MYIIGKTDDQHFPYKANRCVVYKGKEFKDELGRYFPTREKAIEFVKEEGDYYVIKE